jgi:hypothetical protein
MVIGRGVWTCLFLAAALLVATPARAQVSGGTLSGAVSDPAGGGIPQAQLVIKNVATAVERSVTTNDDGFYTVAVAANFATAGTGSDTGGSIRSPASATSLVGLRPTRGLISRDGIVPYLSRRIRLAR